MSLDRKNNGVKISYMLTYQGNEEKPLIIPVNAVAWIFFWDCHAQKEVII